MRTFLLFLISFYQKHLSRYKGFRCAYGSYHQGLSCSGRIKNIIAEHGVIDGWPLIKQQFVDCQQACEALQQQDNEKNKRQKERRRPRRRQECWIHNDNKRDCAETLTDCIPDLDCLPDLPCGLGRHSQKSIQKAIADNQHS
jgi:putative component of membrane protein insertase Oxa1/YidC/SpoIIIJ protein YidD